MVRKASLLPSLPNVAADIKRLLSPEFIEWAKLDASRPPQLMMPRGAGRYLTKSDAGPMTCIADLVGETNLEEP
jgi:hypothetical protein